MTGIIRKSDDKKDLKDLRIVVDKDRLDEVDPKLIQALMNVRISPSDEIKIEKKVEKDVIEDLFDSIINDITVISSKKEPEIPASVPVTIPIEIPVEMHEHPIKHEPKVVTNPPITSPDQISKVTDLSILDPNLKNDVILENIIVDNSLIIILEAKIHLLKRKGVYQDLVMELEELLNNMTEGNKLALTQRWQHIVSTVTSRGIIDIRAFLHVIGDLYFTEEKLF